MSGVIPCHQTRILSKRIKGEVFTESVFDREFSDETQSLKAVGESFFESNGWETLRAWQESVLHLATVPYGGLSPAAGEYLGGNLMMLPRSFFINGLRCNWC